MEGLAVGQDKKDEAAKFASWANKGNRFDCTNDLLKADEYVAQNMNMKGGSPVKIFYFRFKETKEAKAIMDQYSKFLLAAGKQKLDYPPDDGKTAFFRNANIMVLMYANNWHASKWFRQKMLGVKFETDTD